VRGARPLSQGHEALVLVVREHTLPLRHLQRLMGLQSVREKRLWCYRVSERNGYGVTECQRETVMVLQSVREKRLWCFNVSERNGYGVTQCQRVTVMVLQWC
jgi:RNase P/RNase MRP subunit POP5